MNIREQFEDWYVREYPWGRDALSIAEFIGDDECGHYNDMSFAGVLSASWKSWQAASKAPEEQLTESRREFTAANATIHNLELQLADAEARGVDKFATEIGSVHKQLRPGSNHAHALKSVVFRAVEFAAQLRQGAEHE